MSSPNVQQPSHRFRAQFSKVVDGRPRPSTSGFQFVPLLLPCTILFAPIRWIRMDINWGGARFVPRTK